MSYYGGKAKRRSTYGERRGRLVDLEFAEHEDVIRVLDRVVQQFLALDTTSRHRHHIVLLEFGANLV